MKEFQTNWTKNELRMYIFIYCANADFVENSNEIELIKAKVSKDGYQKIHAEYTEDNDYDSIQKIKYAMERFKYSSEEKESLLDEIKTLFLTDGKFDMLEKNLLKGINRVFNM